MAPSEWASGRGKRPRPGQDTEVKERRTKRRKGEGRKVTEEEEASSDDPGAITPSLVGFSDLPMELVQLIHLYAKNPNLALVNRSLHDGLAQTTAAYKARYLLARWHEAYCYGTAPLSSKLRRPSTHPTNRHPSSSNISNRPPLPSVPGHDLLENGAVMELEWTGRFIPVLPTNDFSFPLDHSFHRSADHHVLDYCLRYPLCDVTVLHAVEDMVLNRTEFGNIVMATGLWRHATGQLYPLEMGQVLDNDDDGPVRRSELSRTIPDQACTARAAHLRISEIPKRLFKLNKISAVKGDISGPEESSPNLGRYVEGLDPALGRHLLAFGGPDERGPFPSYRSLLQLLSIAALHLRIVDMAATDAAPFNSFDGLPLARACFAQSLFQVQLLLALGADPARKGSLSLFLAIRAGWLDGLIQMVERDNAKLTEWGTALDGIRSWFARWEKRDAGDRAGVHHFFRSIKGALPSTTFAEEALPVEEERTPLHTEIHERTATEDDGAVLTTHTPPPTSHRPGQVRATSMTPSSSTKRRRLLDRVPLDTKMLQEAVRHERWPVANWLRTKGIVPDLRTIKLIESKQASADSVYV